MAGVSNSSSTNDASLLAKIKEKGISLKDVLAAQSNAETASSESVKLVETQDTSQRQTTKKKNVAAGSGRKRKPSATPSAPVRKSQRTKKVPDHIVKEEPLIPETEVDRSMESRSIVAEAVLDRVSLAGHQLVEISNLLIAQGWDHLFREEVSVDEDTVREFYSEFNLDDKSGLYLATFVVNGEPLAISPRQLGKILDVPLDGYAEYIKGIWPASVAKADVISRVGEDPNNTSNQGQAVKLGVISRLLHRLICTTLTPRSQKHGVVTFMDFLLLDKLRNKERINLPKIILMHMKQCAESKTHGLPYPGLIKKILCSQDAYVPRKEEAFSFVVGKETLEGLGWRFDAETGWQNARHAPAPPMTEIPQAVEPLNQQPLFPSEGSSAVLEALQVLAGKVERLTERVTNLESVADKLLLGSDVVWVTELRSVVKEIDESAKINTIHGTQIREEMVELNKQLRFVGTELVDQMKIVFKG